MKRLAWTSYKRYKILGSQAEEDFDRIVALTSRVFDAPLACVSLVADDFIWFKSTHGFEADEIPREGAFCGRTVDLGKTLIVSDAKSDAYFQTNPLVTGEMGVRFYAGSPLLSPSGLPIGTLCILDRKPREAFSPSQIESLADLTNMIMDRIELRFARLAQQDSEKRFHQVAVSLGEGIACADSNGRIEFWNPGAEAIFGHTQSEMLGQPLDTLFAIDKTTHGVDTILELPKNKLREPGGFSTELRGLRKSGKMFHLEACFSGWSDDDSFHYSVIMRDVSERKREEGRIRYLAQHDTLTGLINRDYLRKVLGQAIAVAGETGRKLSLLLMDLNHFKDINDTLGHACGDEILCQVAQRLRQCMRNSQYIARLSGDEFAIVLDDLVDVRDAQGLAERITKALRREPFIIDDQQLFVDASIGIANFPENGSLVDELFANADLALYRAKDRNRGGHVIYKPEFRRSLEDRRRIECELQRAVYREEFELHFQPQVRISDSQVVGAEALIRWNHPERGLLTPAAFLSVLNSGIHADDVGLWVLNSACKQARVWHDQGHPIRIGVNLTPSQFRTADLASLVDQSLQDTGISSELLELEVTENIFLEDDEHTIATLKHIRDLGVAIAFDDFGTGYASLSHLKRFPLDRIKIDRAFVRDIVDDPEDASIVRAIIGLGRLLSLAVTAEGIEIPGQLKFLQDQGCDEAQGYFFGKPMSASDFADFLTDQTAVRITSKSASKKVA